MANIFENEISRSIKFFNWHGAKLSTFNGRSGHSEPYDFWILVNGIHYGVEAKKSEIFGSFEFKRLEPHQRQGLLDCEKDKGKGYIVISFRKDKNRKSNIRAYIISIKNWIKLEKKHSNRKSIPEIEFIECKLIEPLNKFRQNGTLHWYLKTITTEEPKIGKRRNNSNNK